MHVVHEDPEDSRREIMQNAYFFVHQLVTVQQKAELLIERNKKV